MNEPVDQRSRRAGHEETQVEATDDPGQQPSGSREASREAVASGMGMSVMSATEFPSADHRCVALAIKEPTLRITEYVACLKNRRDLRTVREFFRVAAECQPDLAS